MVLASRRLEGFEGPAFCVKRELTQTCDACVVSSYDPFTRETKPSTTASSGTSSANTSAR